MFGCEPTPLGVASNMPL